VVLYYIGAAANLYVLRYMLNRFGRWIGISMADVDRVLGVFSRHGEMIVFFGRLIPVVRSLISIPAGMHRMPMGRFLLFTIAGSAIWTGALTYAGMVLGQNWSQVLGFLKTYQNATIAALIGAMALFVAWKLIQRTRARRTAQ
jgi:membrane protein DedA with SNARE-associated domain